MLNKIKTATEKNGLIYGLALTLFGAILLLQPISFIWSNLSDDLGASSEAVSIISILFGGLILLTSILSIFKFLKEKQKLKKIDILFLVFGLIALLSFLWSTDTESTFLAGLRYSLFAVSGYFIGRAFSVKIDFWDKILKFLLWFTVLVSSAQLVVWLFGGESLLVASGYGIEHFAGSWPRLSGPFPGPNQLATFLTIATLWLYWRKKITVQVFVLAFMIVLFTFSRSAILGLLAGFLIPFIFIHTPRVKRLGMAVVASAILVLVAASIYYVEPLRNNFVGLRHTDERVSALQTSYNKFDNSSILQVSFGHGAGTSGPASVFSDEPFIPENWLIQIGYEYGVVGLLFLMAGWFALAYWGYKNKRPWITAIVLAVFVNSFFLHPLSDNFPAAIWFYLLLGAGFSELNSNKETYV